MSEERKERLRFTLSSHAQFIHIPFAMSASSARPKVCQCFKRLAFPVCDKRGHHGADDSIDFELNCPTFELEKAQRRSQNQLIETSRKEEEIVVGRVQRTSDDSKDLQGSSRGAAV